MHNIIGKLKSYQTPLKRSVIAIAGTDRIEDWFIYIVPCFPIHVQTVKTYN